MYYDAVLAQALELLQREKRLSYRVLKRRLGMDDDELEDLKEDLIYAKKLAVDEAGRVLVWTGSVVAEPPPTSPGQAPDQTPLTYTPPHLMEKILASRAALEGERKQVTVLFADLKDSTELMPRPAIRKPPSSSWIRPSSCMMDAVHRFEGTVNQVLGDGIMALFGAPLAHEDHAVRACYTTLAMQAAMHAYTDEVRRTHGLEVQHARRASTPGRWSSVPLAMTCTWTTRRLAQTTHSGGAHGTDSPRLARILLNSSYPPAGRRAGPGQRSGAWCRSRGSMEPVEVFELVGASGSAAVLAGHSGARTHSALSGVQTELVALGQALAAGRRPGMGRSQR